MDASDIIDEPPPKPFALSLVVNHDGTQRIFRSLPLVVRITASFDRDPAESFALRDEALIIQVKDNTGTMEAWTFETLGADPARTLDAEHPSVEAVRLMSAEATSAVPAGARTIELTWGPVFEVFAVTVEDALAADPGPDGRAAREARAMLEADALMLRADFAGAKAGLDAALSADPTSVALLNQRALVLEQAGDLPAAFQDTQKALTEFRQQYPEADEPPITILEINNRLFDRVIGGGE